MLRSARGRSRNRRYPEAWTRWVPGIESLEVRSVPAGLVPVADPGFESPPLAPGAFTVGDVPGWVVTGGLAGVYRPTAAQFPGGVPEGQNVAFSNGGTISQTLTTALGAGTYTLQVDVGARQDTPSPGYDVQLCAGNTVLADSHLVPLASGHFATATVTYTAAAADPSLGQSLQVRLSSAGNQIDFDNVRLGGPVVNAPRDYQFGNGSNPAVPGYTPVNATPYSPALGYGWSSGAVWAGDRGTSDPLTRGFNYTNDGTFAVDLPDGLYQVTIRLGDTVAGHHLMDVYLQGTAVEKVGLVAGQVMTKVDTASVANGRLDLRLASEAPSDFAVIEALSVRPATAFDFGTPGSPVAAGYTRVDGTTYSQVSALPFDSSNGPAYPGRYGWTSGAVGYDDRGVGTDLTRDFNYVINNTFQTNVSPGVYTIQVTLGDRSYSHAPMRLTLSGASGGGDGSTINDTVNPSALYYYGGVETRVYTITVGATPGPGPALGTLSLGLQSTSGNDFAVIEGLSLAPAASSTTFDAAFNFGNGSNPAVPGYTPVNATPYSPALGYGWISGSVGAGDRGTGDPLTRGFNFTNDGTFAVDLPDGFYEVVLTLGDTVYGHAPMDVYLEGGSNKVDTVSPAAGQVVTSTYDVTIYNAGRLYVRIASESGNDFAVIESLQIINLDDSPSDASFHKI